MAGAFRSRDRGVRNQALAHARVDFMFTSDPHGH